MTEPIAVVAVALVDDLQRPTRLLAARRTEPPSLAGGWEFPGGKVDPGESEIDAVHRELAEELGVAIELGRPIDGPLADGRWPLGERYALRLWWAVVIDGEPAPLEDHDELRWLSVADLRSVAWLPADAPIIDVLEPHLALG